MPVVLCFDTLPIVIHNSATVPVLPPDSTYRLASDASSPERRLGTRGAAHRGRQSSLGARPKGRCRNHKRRFEQAWLTDRSLSDLPRGSPKPRFLS